MALFKRGEHARTTTDEQAKRTLRHASKTGRSDPDGLRGAKKAAADHYATEADKARRERE